MRNTVGGSAYPVGYRGQVIRLAQITTDVQTHYFATEETDFDAHHYRPWLIIDEPIHYYRSFQANTAALKLQNVDGQLEDLLAAEKFSGAAVILYDYLTGLGAGWTEVIELIRGVLSERRGNPRTCGWQIVPKWDPGTVETPLRTISRDCPWKFKTNECGYAGAETTCDKTYDTCKNTMFNEHRFAGCIQITAALQQLYPPVAGGQPADSYPFYPWGRPWQVT